MSRVVLIECSSSCNVVWARGFGEVLPPLPSLQSLFRNFLNGLCVVHDPLEISSESSAQRVAQQRERDDGDSQHQSMKVQRYHLVGVEVGEWNVSVLNLLIVIRHIIAWQCMWYVRLQTLFDVQENPSFVEGING